MNSSRGTSLLLILAVILMLAAVGCGRTYWITGRVVFYEQSDASSGSIEEITGSRMTSEGTPVADAIVGLTHRLDENGDPVRRNVWGDSFTDAEGYFEIMDYGPPSDEKRLGIRVGKEGFEEVITTYIDYYDTQLQEFLVVLVPK